jgi:hypothetical protein
MYDRLLNDLPLEKMHPEEKRDWLTPEVFVVDNIADYIYHQVIDEELELTDFPNVAPCFPSMFFEYSNPKWSKGDGVITTFPDEVNHLGVLIVSKELPENNMNIKWISRAISIVEMKVPPLQKYRMSPNSNFVPIIQIDYFVKSNGELTSFDGKGNFLYHVYVAGCQNAQFFVPWMSLSFMHCKNVQVEDFKSSDKLNKSREKKGKYPLCNYHILNIAPMKKNLENDGTIQTVGLKKALHICRGHFKDFSKGGGLFGKYQGLYWWDAQVRGKISEGVVLKDYKISTEKE